MGLLDQFFGPPTKDKFAQLFMDGIRKAGEKRKLVYIPAESCIHLADDPSHKSYIDNTYAEYSSVPREATYPRLGPVRPHLVPSLPYLLEAKGSPMVKLKPLNFVLVLWAISLTAFLPAAFGKEDGLPELNRKVLQFAEDHRGQKVGNGECWTLAADALKHAGATRPGTNGLSVAHFGRRLNEGETILPGDVAQFTKAKFVDKTKHGSSSHVMQYHVAIVAKVDGNKITLLHQNYGGKKIVGTFTINLANKKEGTVDFFRPEPKSEKK